MVACGRGLNHSGTILIRSGTVSVSGIASGFPSLFVDNHDSFAARKKPFLFNLNKFPDLKILWFWIIILAIANCLFEIQFWNEIFIC